jgi:two-component system response regulator
MKKRSILLVEDNPHEETLTTRLLEQHGIFTEVAVARDGEEALDNLLGDGNQASEAKAELPSLILLDLNLPKIHGLEVLRRLRAHPLTRMLPVVILTSSLEESDIAAAYYLGANSYIQKPVDFDEFSESIKRVSEYWGVLNTFLPA